MGSTASQMCLSPDQKNQILSALTDSFPISVLPDIYFCCIAFICLVEICLFFYCSSECSIRDVTYIGKASWVRANHTRYAFCTTVTMNIWKE